jgi:hypothetical protein
MPVQYPDLALEAGQLSKLGNLVVLLFKPFAYSNGMK